MALLLGGYTAGVGLVPLPDLQPELVIPAEQELSADEAAAAAIPADQSGPTGVGFADGEAVWSSDDETHEIASITKLVTALVGLEASPLDAGDDGPVYTVGEEDAAIRERVLQDNGVVEDTPAGLELTTRQMLELILMASANNYAISYVDWVFGSEQRFVEAADAWAGEHGLESLSIADPTGLSAENVASTSDLIGIARLALEHPVVAEIVAQSWVNIPEIGPVENTNPLLGEPEVIGLKTGTTTTAGYNLVAARSASVGGRELVAIAATLGRDDESARAEDTRAVLESVLGTVQTLPLVEPETVVGEVTVWDGGTVELVAPDGATSVLAPGESAVVAGEVGSLAAGGAGSVVGSLTIEAPTGTQQLRVVTASEVAEPDLWWRLTHPAVVFGWVDP